MEWYLKCLKQHYFDFNGRARRKEYWMFTLVNVVITIPLQIALALINPKLVAISYIYSLAVMLPGLGVTARRLHDIGKSGWMILVCLIPLVGPLVVIYWLCQDSQSGSNAYGENPKAA